MNLDIYKNIVIEIKDNINKENNLNEIFYGLKSCMDLIIPNYNKIVFHSCECFVVNILEVDNKKFIEAIYKFVVPNDYKYIDNSNSCESNKYIIKCFMNNININKLFINDFYINSKKENITLIHKKMLDKNIWEHTSTNKKIKRTKIIHCNRMDKKFLTETIFNKNFFNFENENRTSFIYFEENINTNLIKAVNFCICLQCMTMFIEYLDIKKIELSNINNICFEDIQKNQLAKNFFSNLNKNKYEIISKNYDTYDFVKTTEFLYPKDIEDNELNMNINGCDYISYFIINKNLNDFSKIALAISFLFTHDEIKNTIKTIQINKIVLLQYPSLHIFELIIEFKNNKKNYNWDYSKFLDQMKIKFDEIKNILNENNIEIIESDYTFVELCEHQKKLLEIDICKIYCNHQKSERKKIICFFNKEDKIIYNYNDNEFSEEKYLNQFNEYNNRNK